MKDTILVNKTNIITDRKVKTNINEAVISPKWNINNPAIDNLIAEGGENFLHYLIWLGLKDDPNLLVLSSRQHYYYDHNELKSTTTLINMKKLNQIKHIDSFLHALNHVLSPKTNFIGCFSDSNNLNGSGLTSRMYKGFINFLDSRINIEFDKESVSKLLKLHGFKVLDISELNGQLYFHAQKLQTTGN